LVVAALDLGTRQRQQVAAIVGCIIVRVATADESGITWNNGNEHD
jgi:hypothetical protein